MIELVVPTVELKEKALGYRQEHFDFGETVINGSERFDQIKEYEVWLKAVEANANPATVSADWVVTDTFFAVDENSEIVGIIDFRHELNGWLADFGHCGYSVRPSQRNKGYATQMLAKIKEIAKKAGLSELQLSVERSNTASVRTIVKNGGILSRSFLFEEKPADVYIIKLQ